VSVDWKTVGGTVVFMLLGVVGNVLLSLGMRQMTPMAEVSVSSVLRLLKHVTTTPAILGATACLAVGYLMFLAVLSRADVSVVRPATAGSYLFTAVAAQWILHEHVTPARWAGILVVTLGVIICLATSGSKAPTATGATTTAYPPRPETQDANSPESSRLPSEHGPSALRPATRPR
jgi:multidrug transporter EmrE-like cation transporter